MNKKTVGIGLLGLGTVGTGVAKVLLENAKELEAKTGIAFKLQKVCVKSLSKPRGVKLSRGILTTNPREVIQHPLVDIVVELVGGIHPARELVLEAFKNHKHVVTANKALIAEKGSELLLAAERTGQRLGLEASVCGGIPIIKSLREGLVANRISHLFGIVNGTCNFILSAMSDESLDFQAALEKARKLGFAEKNPALDIDGVDSAHKLAILARLAFHAEIPFSSIFVEGIRDICHEEIAYAQELGYTIKLLAIAKRMKEGLELRVHPTMVPLKHPLSNVSGAYNAVFVHGDLAGDILLYGRGAGRTPTASAVWSDVIDIAKRGPQYGALARENLQRLKILPVKSVVSKYYLRFQVEDRPGVLGRIAQVLGANHISILSVHQKESHATGSVPVIILTYEAKESDIRKALKTIDASRHVRKKTILMRVEK